jgi:hypothetical protein
VCAGGWSFLLLSPPPPSSQRCPLLFLTARSTLCLLVALWTSPRMPTLAHSTPTQSEFITQVPPFFLCELNFSSSSFIIALLSSSDVAEPYHVHSLAWLALPVQRRALRVSLRWDGQGRERSGWPLAHRLRHVESNGS